MGPATTTAVKYLILCYSITLHKRYRNWHRPWNIPQDYLEKFVTKSEAGGVSLGLFISKSFVDAHGGKISAENNPDGKGAAFCISLPVSIDIMMPL